MERWNKLQTFLSNDIWRIRAGKLKGRHSFWITQLRTFLLAYRGFDEDKCQLRASALTYYSLLSIVPVLAMVFGIAKGFGFQHRLEDLLLERMHGQEEVVTRIIVFSQSLLENTQGGLIAGLGVAFLFWTVINVLSNIEVAFNEIWGVQKQRSWTRKFSDYLALMLIAPLLLLISSSATVLITGKVTSLVQHLQFLGFFGDVILWLLAILPFAVMWVLFVFLYIFMPNTKVEFPSALIGGILGGTIYQVVQWVYITFQINVSAYGAIYGSFAALPLFLLWLQMSWLIVLFGAEISFAQQNVHTYEFEPDCLKVSLKLKRLIALGVTQCCVKQFAEGRPPLDAEEIANRLETPIRLINLIIFELTEAGILSEIKLEDGRRVTFQPARDINDLTIAKVFELLDNRGVHDIPFLETQEIKKIAGALDHLSKTLKESKDNLKLKEI